jgi:hypothetical protein
VERERRDLEAETGQQQSHAQQHHRVAVRQRLRNRRDLGRAGDAVHERHAVDDHRRRHRADEEELQRRFRGDGIPLEESRQQIQRDRHQLERDEQQDQLTRRRERAHADQRQQQREVILGRASTEASRSMCEGREQADRRRDDEHTLRENSQLVDDEHAALE